MTFRKKRGAALKVLQLLESFVVRTAPHLKSISKYRLTREEKKIWIQIDFRVCRKRLKTFLPFTHSLNQRQMQEKWACPETKNQHQIHDSLTHVTFIGFRQTLNSILFSLLLPYQRAIEPENQIR